MMSAWGQIGTYPGIIFLEEAVPRYFPIDAGATFDCAQSDILAISWRADRISADFILPGIEERALRICFNAPTIVRLLDEMPLSTEGGTKNEGLVPRHFAYRVEGSTFADTQSDAWKLVFHPILSLRIHHGIGLHGRTLQS